MASVALPYGLSLYNTVDSAFGGTLKTFPIASGTTGGVVGNATSYNLYTGDPICFAQSANGLTTSTVRIACQVAADAGDALNIGAPVDGSPVLGVLQGVNYCNAQGQKIMQNFWIAGTTTFVANMGTTGNVNIDGLVKVLPSTKQMVYKIQATGNPSAGDIKASKNYFLGRCFNFSAPVIQSESKPTSQTTGQSSMSLNHLSGAGSSIPAYPKSMRVIGIASTPSSNIDAQWADAYPDLLVQLLSNVF